MPRRERAELVRRDALGDQLGLQTPAELPPRLEIALVPRGEEQAHPRPPPGDLDDVDDDHHADGDERQHEDETQDRLRLAALGAEQQQKTRQRRGEYRHQRRHPQRHRRHIVPCLMDRQHDPAGHQHGGRRDEQHVPAPAQPLAVKKQQNARARHREEGRKLAERSEKLAEAALPAGIEKFGDRQIPDGTHDHQKQQHRADHAAAAEIGLF